MADIQSYYLAMKKKKISQAGGPARKAVQSQTSTPQRILVVEDDVDIRQLNSDVLRESGYHVDIAGDGMVAWQALQNDQYDLLITDNHMPMMTGLELISKLRSEDMKLPVILVSGTMPTEELRQQPWLEIQATLLKPYTLGELFILVKEVLCAHGDAHEQSASPSDWQIRTATDGLQL